MAAVPPAVRADLAPTGKLRAGVNYGNFILATKDPQGDDVSCDIVKTWRETDITKMLGGRFDWTWGKAVCQSKLEVKREAMAQSNAELQEALARTTWAGDCHSWYKTNGGKITNNWSGRTTSYWWRMRTPTFDELEIG